MSLNSRRVRAIVGKELRDFRRNRNLTVGMAIVPVLFCVQPLVAVFTLDPAASTALRHEHVLLYMLGIPALVPSLPVWEPGCPAGCCVLFSGCWFWLFPDRCWVLSGTRSGVKTWP